MRKKPEVPQPKVETKEPAKPEPVEAKKEEVEEPKEPEAIQTQYKKLSGPKITGDKIDLSQFNQAQEKERRA